MIAARPIAILPREATRLARALRASGIEAGDRVAYMCPNIPELLIAHFAVPLAGAVLVAINTRLATEEVRYICEHSGAKLLVVDSELRSIVAPLQDELEALREIVTVTDPVAEVDDAEAPGARAMPTCSSVDPTSRWPGRSTTSWLRSRSTTRRGPPGSPRASSTPTAAPT